MLLSPVVRTDRGFGLSFYTIAAPRRCCILLARSSFPACNAVKVKRCLPPLTHLSRSPLEQNIIQPLVLSLLHLCRNVVNMPPVIPQPRGDFLYHSICNWVQDNYAQPLTRESVAQF